VDPFLLVSYRMALVNRLDYGWGLPTEKFRPYFADGIPENGAVVHVHAPPIAVSEIVRVDVVIGAAIGCSKFSRVRLSFYLIFGEDVQEGSVFGRQVDLVGIGQFESGRRRAPSQKIDRLIGQQKS